MAASPVVVDVVGGDEREPEEVVGESGCGRRARRAGATSAGRRLRGTAATPPGGSARASPGRRVDQGHDVLELVAEAVGAARLVERRARPRRGSSTPGRAASGSAAGPRPGRGCVTCTAPRSSSHRWLHRLERRAGPARLAVAARAGRGRRRRRRPRRAGRRSPAPRPGRARTAPAARRRGRAPPRHGPTASYAPSAAGAGEVTVAAEELGAVGGDGARPQVDVGERHARAQSVRKALRASRAPVSASISVTTCMALASRVVPSTHSA